MTEESFTGESRAARQGFVLENDLFIVHIRAVDFGPKALDRARVEKVARRPSSYLNIDELQWALRAPSDRACAEGI
jgi:hypothetical protein